MTMSTPLQSMGPSERREQVAGASSALDAGGLVVFPTETVYGIGCLGTDLSALDRLGALTGRDEDPAWNPAWHAPSAGAVLDAVGALPSLHRRLIERLAPGPVTFVLAPDHPDVPAIRERIGLAWGAGRGAALGIRVPDHPIASEMLRLAGVPVVATRLAAAEWGEDRALSDGSIDRARRAGIESVLDDGACRFGSPSTTIELDPEGGYRIVRTGVYDARTIAKRIERLILFVCTGNTCRSPMAAALALAELAGRSPAIPTRVESAGLSAMPGAPAADEAVDAVGELGIDLRAHRARGLDPALLASADLILVMTEQHRRAVESMDASAGARTMTLDPSGQDVPDPIGQDATVYRRTRERLRSLIAQRIEELER